MSSGGSDSDDLPPCPNKTFPFKLWEAACSTVSDLLSWSPDGSRLLVNEERFEAEVMDTFPHLVKIPSFLNFRRQLREYSFGWCSTGNGNFEFYHPNLHMAREKCKLSGILTRRKESYREHASQEGEDGEVQPKKRRRQRRSLKTKPCYSSSVYYQEFVPENVQKVGKEVFVLARPLSQTDKQDGMAPHLTEEYEPPRKRAHMMRHSGTDAPMIVVQPDCEEYDVTQRHVDQQPRVFTSPAPTRISKEVMHEFTSGYGGGSGDPGTSSNRGAMSEGDFLENHPLPPFKRTDQFSYHEPWNQYNRGGLPYQAVHPQRSAHDSSSGVYSLANSGSLTGGSVQTHCQYSWQPYPPPSIVPPLHLNYPAPPGSTPLSGSMESLQPPDGPSNTQQNPGYIPVMYAWLPTPGLPTVGSSTDISAQPLTAQALTKSPCACVQGIIVADPVPEPPQLPEIDEQLRGPQLIQEVTCDSQDQDCQPQSQELEHVQLDPKLDDSGSELSIMDIPSVQAAVDLVNDALAAQ